MLNRWEKSTAGGQACSRTGVPSLHDDGGLYRELLAQHTQHHRSQTATGNHGLHSENLSIWPVTDWRGLTSSVWLSLGDGSGPRSVLPASGAMMCTMELSQVLILPSVSCGERNGLWSGSPLLPGGASSSPAHLQTPCSQGKSGVLFFKVFFF